MAARSGEEIWEDAVYPLNEGPQQLFWPLFLKPQGSISMRPRCPGRRTHAGSPSLRYQPARFKVGGMQDPQTSAMEVAKFLNSLLLRRVKLAPLLGARDGGSRYALGN